MSGIIIPRSLGPPRHHPLRELLRERDAKDFRDGVLMTDAVSRAVERVLTQQRLRNTHVLRALVTCLVSAVQAMAPTEEWADVGVILADEIRARLTVEQD
jgi:hypothetical protein